LDPDRQRVVGTTDYDLNRLTLQFRNRAVEARFAVECLTTALPSLRVSLLGAAVTYGSFGALDWLMIPDIKGIAAAIRYALVCPFLLAIVAFSYSKSFPRIAQYVLPAAMLVSGLGIVTMIALAHGPGHTVYYAGLILVTIIGSTLVPIGWIRVAIVSMFVLAAYQLVAIRANPISAENLLNNDFFLTAAVGAGIVASYLQELQNRRLFIRDEGLRLAREQSDALRIKAEAANTAKSEFLAVMSHELRTPLNAILGFSEIMQMQVFGPLGSERYTGYAGDIHESAEHLLGIITDILDLSKAEVGKLSIHEADVDVMGTLDYCLRLLRERAAEHGIRLSLRPLSGGESIVLRGDERLLKQVFLNVIGNALKFTPAGGAVQVGAALHADRSCVVHVSDTGIGISEADLERIFEPFFQIESAFARKNGGAGLGLPLVKKIAELHGGGVRIRSTLGAGTEVTLWFPPERVTAGAAPPIAGVA
jgi:signal transduction histidine kinase